MRDDVAQCGMLGLSRRREGGCRIRKSGALNGGEKVLPELMGFPQSWQEDGRSKSRSRREQREA